MATLEENIKQSIADFDSIKAAIESKGVAVPYGTDTKAYGSLIDSIDTNGGYEQGYEDGKNIITTKALTIRFSDLNFGVHSITLNLNNITTMSQLFFEALGDTSEVTINCPNLITAINAAFDGDTTDTKLKKITLNVNTEKVTTFNAFVWGRKGLEIIDGTPLNFSSATVIGSAFIGCSSLRELRIAPNTIKVACNLSACSSLSNDTIQSVVDGLADLTGGTTQTLDLHADIVAKLTENQLTQIANKNWSVV